jgi:apolipoprotein N-acyltransferase
MKTGSLLKQEAPAALPQPFKARKPAKLPVAWLTLPALTGGLLWLTFYPVGWGFLGWVALAPLLLLVRLDARPWQLYLGSFLGGCVFFWSVLTWMTVADYRMVYLWGMLATYCALYFPAALFLIRRLDRATGWPLTVTVPLAWTGLEFVRSFMLTGFAWYYLGHSQHHYLAVIQIADLGGAYAISFVMAAVNGWLVEYLLTLPELRVFLRQADAVPAKAGAPARRFGFAVLVLVGAMLGYGGWRLSQDQFLPGPRVALLQGNLDQRFRNEAAGVDENAVRTRQEIYRYYLSLCAGAINQRPFPDLLVWPETSYPFPWLELPQDLNKLPAEVREDVRDDARDLQRRVREIVQTTKANHLFGLNVNLVDEQGKARAYNSALLVSREGNAIGRYDKIHRVPFGEYVPLRGWLPFVDDLVPFGADYGVQIGEKMTRLPLGPYHFGVLICNEDTDPCLARQYGRAAADGPAVDFLVNVANEGWFDGSSEHAEHLATSRFRAIEARRALVRAVNMGISAVIDSNGRVQKPREKADVGGIKVWSVEPEGRDEVPDLPEGQWREFTKVPGVLSATIPIDNRVSLYAWAGDWLPIGCWLLIGGVWLRRRVKKVAGAA